MPIPEKIHIPAHSHALNTIKKAVESQYNFTSPFFVLFSARPRFSIPFAPADRLAAGCVSITFHGFIPVPPFTRGPPLSNF